MKSKLYMLEVSVKDGDDDRVFNKTGWSIYNVRFLVESVMRDGTAEIKIVSQSNKIGEIVKRVTDTTFQIVMLNQSEANNASYKVLSRDQK